MDLSRGIFQNAYVGYRIFNRYWGRGYGSEAVSLCLRIAFKDLRLHRVEAAIEPQNRRSLRLVRSLGMRLEGRSLQRLFLRGEWLDFKIYAITTEEAGYKFRGKPESFGARF